jgi:hypothetical protein
MTARAPTGLLLATMEPSPTLEEEFQQWYDSEHFPERQGTEGFLTAARYICLDGWPRYLALYDLSDVEVLRGPGYAKIAGGNYSRWTERVVSRVWGQYRAEGVQLYPGNSLQGSAGHHARLALWRFRNVTPGDEGAIVEGLRAIYEGKPQTAQVRVFDAKFANGKDVLGIVELHAPFTPEPSSLGALGKTIRNLDIVNIYTRYERRWPGDYPKNT